MNTKNEALTFDTPEMISVLLFVGVFRAILEADSVSCRMAVSATGSSPLERRLLSEQHKHRYVPQHYTRETYINHFITEKDHRVLVSVKIIRLFWTYLFINMLFFCLNLS